MANSQAERKVKRIKEKLRIIVRQTGRDFPEVLGFIINSINKSANEARLTAEQILFSFSTPSQSDELVFSLETNDHAKYNSILKKTVEEFHKKIKQTKLRRAELNQNYHNQRTRERKLHLGQVVSIRNLRLQANTGYHVQRVGPCVVLKITDSTCMLRNVLIMYLNIMRGVFWDLRDVMS